MLVMLNQLERSPTVIQRPPAYTLTLDFTYRELRIYSLATAARLRRRLQVSDRNASGTVGLLCSSTPEFILTWLGLMRLGISVMLLAYVTCTHPTTEQH